MRPGTHETQKELTRSGLCGQADPESSGTRRPPSLSTLVLSSHLQLRHHLLHRPHVKRKLSPPQVLAPVLTSALTQKTLSAVLQAPLTGVSSNSTSQLKWLKPSHLAVQGTACL